MKNEFQRVGNRITIYLDQRDGSQVKAIIDDEDLPKVFAYRKWRILRGNNGKHYCVTQPWTKDGKIDRSKVIFLHRLVMGQPHGDRSVEVGFLSGDSFDCRKANLVVGCHADQMQHTEKVKNVSKDGRNIYDHGASFGTRKKIYGKRHNFGSFATKQEAEDAIKIKTLETLKEIAAQGNRPEKK